MLVFLALASFLPLSTRAPSAQLKGFFLSSSGREQNIAFQVRNTSSNLSSPTYCGISQTSFLTSPNPYFFIHKTGMTSTSQSWETGPNIDSLHLAHLTWWMSVPPGLYQCLLAEHKPQGRSLVLRALTSNEEYTQEAVIPPTFLIPSFSVWGLISILSGAILQALSHPF